MVTLTATTLRRRCAELKLSGEREAVLDADTSALVKFYSAECGIKSVYMQQNGLKDTDDERAGKRSAKSYSHRIQDIVADLRISPREVPAPPAVTLTRTGTRIHPQETHEGWRYGEKIEDTREFAEWLDKVIRWVERQA